VHPGNENPGYALLVGCNGRLAFGYEHFSSNYGWQAVKERNRTVSILITPLELGLSGFGSSGTQISSRPNTDKPTW